MIVGRYHENLKQDILAEIKISDYIFLNYKTNKSDWNQIRSKKKKNFCITIKKKASHTISIYGNCMSSIFFSKKREHRFFLSPDCFTRIKQPQKLVYIFFQTFFENEWKLYDKHFSTHLMYGIVW